MTIKAAGAEIAKAIAPVILEGRRDLQSALKEIVHKPTDAMNRPLRESDLQRIMRGGFVQPSNDENFL
jgi:hypothetical protein